MLSNPLSSICNSDAGIFSEVFTFAAVWLSAPLLHIFVENLFGQVRRSAPKHSHLHVNEERAVPCQHSSEDVAHTHTHTHTHTHISNAVLQCSLICCLLRISVLLIIFSLILVFGIVSSYTRYKIRKVQRVFSEKSPTLPFTVPPALRAKDEPF